MSYGDYLKAMLQPLGIFDLEDSINGAELESWGGALDACEAHLNETETEMSLITAEDFGLTRILALLKYKPVYEDAEGLRTALIALLQIGNGSFTLAAVNAALAGCGVSAVISETDEHYVVAVDFPDLYYHQSDLIRMIRIIESIVPCHLKIEYSIESTTWEWLEEQALTWGDLDDGSQTWLYVMVLSGSESES